MATVMALQTVRIAVLARFLSPEAFGTMAIVLVVVGFVSIYNETGLSEAIIQRTKRTDADISRLFWSNILIG